MKPYESYTVEDFLEDESFRKWVQGQGTQEMFWLSFLEKYPGRRDDFRQAEHLIRAANVDGEWISEKEIRAEIERFIENASGKEEHLEISFPDDDEEEESGRTIFWKRWLMAAAAVLALGAGIGWHYYQNNEPEPRTAAIGTSPTNLVTTRNDTDKPLLIHLNDGSEVTLSPRSHLKYPSEFADSARVVYLTGEAVFSVKKQGQTFMVHTGKVVTKVLGTRFVVSAFDDDRNITVQVQTGKVSVYVDKPSEKEVKGLIITANQAAVFEKSANQLSKTLVENPEKLPNNAVESILKYDEVPLPVILRDMEKSYGIPVQFDADSFWACKITVAFSDESMYDKLSILCKTVSASYEIVDGQIIVSGKGCSK
ncbi:FecR family protein [Dyadobacter jiangsuensis]|uniref:FecR family protein n=1 Tax=Dyadobacter jiangsuensis TaxID=1591085 RepID=A0A2P8FNE3_9BACT|nr:FecR family protein [Dyadobacter jiangsuensis]PSL23248.1 FecR family protein [Dyadobacter jiangsuensis]